MIMKPYGSKHRKTGPCVCEYCGASGKLAIKRRERHRAKIQIMEYRVIKKPSKPSFSKAMIEKMMKKK